MSFYLDNGNNITPPEDERPVVYECNDCNDPIRNGDGYYIVKGEYYCDNCVERNHHYAEKNIDYSEEDF